MNRRALGFAPHAAVALVVVVISMLPACGSGVGACVQHFDDGGCFFHYTCNGMPPCTDDEDSVASDASELHGCASLGNVCE